MLALKRAGVSPEKGLKSFRYTGSHPATAQAVAAGACDAGALDETVYKSLVADGKLPGAKLKVFYTTPPFSDYVWAARKELKPADAKAFADALLRLQPGRDDKVLSILRASHYVRADDAEYGDVSRTAKELGLL